MTRKSKFITIVMVLTLAVGAFAVHSALAVPDGLYLVDGNPTCANLYEANVLSGEVTGFGALGDLGPLLGFKYDGNPTGDLTHTLTNNGMWKLNEGVPEDPNNWVSIFNVLLSEGQGFQFDWAASLGIDAVIVKSQDANVYVYVPEVIGAAGLQAPEGKSISHIEFCYDYEVDVTKTADTSFTRTWDWDIEKTPDKDYVGFPGDSWTHNYTITVDKTGYTDSDFAVTGDIIIENNTPFDATIESVTDVISDSIATTVDCGVPFPYTLAAGGTLNCAYSSSLPNADTRLNTATVTTSGDVGGGEATADVIFGEPTMVVNDEVNVTDDYGSTDTGDDLSFGSFSDDGSASYSRDFSCPTDLSMYENGMYVGDTVINTATIDETGDSDDATVTLTCYVWDVSKTAIGTYDHLYKWDITKTVDPELQSGFAGDTLEWTWSISWESVFDKEVNHQVDGVITVTNPATIPLTVDVTDKLSGDFAATVDCGDGEGDTILTIDAGSSGNCGYTAVPGSQLAQNTATATRESISISDTVDVNWTKDQDITPDASISDTNYGDIPMDQGNPFTYTEFHTCEAVNLEFYDEDGTYSGTAENTATISWDSQSDSSTADTDYDCYLWSVDKTARGFYKDVNDWDITKTVDPASQTGVPSQTLEWTWSITWDSFKVGETDHIAGGYIKVTNPAPMPLTVDVSDVFSDGTPANFISCAVSGTSELTIPANSTRGCNYGSGYNLSYQVEQNTVTATRDAVSVSKTVDVSWTKDGDIGLDATISDTNHADIPADSAQPYEYTESHTCSTDRGDYGEDGTYSGDADNEATITWTGGSDSDSAHTDYTCEASFVDIYKTLNGVPVDKSQDIRFTLFSGNTQLDTVSTASSGAEMEFQTALVPGDAYAICEYPVPAGYTFEVRDENDGIVSTYPGPPGADNPTGEIQCFNFVAGDATTTLTFDIDNRYPGGAPRTPGYWKNWSSCSGGNQAATAEALGGVDAGIYILDDFLNLEPPVTFVGDYIITTCERGVLTLGAYAYDPKKPKNMNGDAAYKLAQMLLAAKLNFGAGACVPVGTFAYGEEELTFTQIMAAADELLAGINFDGTGSYFDSKSIKQDPSLRVTAADALYLAGIIDDYNNSELCTGEPSH